GKGFRVDGLRCYWVEDALLYHDGNEDCDAIHSELQDIEEHPSKTAFAVYPNPTNNILFVETVHAPSLPEETQYRITNLMGQTLLQGHITDETQQVDIADLPSGMYFISVGEQTVKFVKQ
ncbi:MAG: T9SS type A sorting domain-containing protein, partial [Bacteroidales bacterium]|nr:T9SS type A sorting domain-containing protein [Bacteroidales bacterium]